MFFPAVTLAVAINIASPVRLDRAAADTLRAAIEKDRRDTAEWLRTDPTSYLATIARVDFGARTSLSVGSDASNDVRIDDASVRARHLRVSVVGDSFRVEPAEGGASFAVRGVTYTEAVTTSPVSIGLGRFLLRLSHQRFPAVIVFDPQSPRFREYKGIAYFPVDFAYRFELPLTPNARPDTVRILSTRGNQRSALRVGWFDFRVGKTACRLEATRLLEPGAGEHSLSVFFRDATSGRESYGMGRYVEAERLADGRYVLDFNNAYNPACAFSEHYNCPIPPKANELRVAIRAGEKDAHYLAH